LITFACCLFASWHLSASICRPSSCRLGRRFQLAVSCERFAASGQPVPGVGASSLSPACLRLPQDSDGPRLGQRGVAKSRSRAVAVGEQVPQQGCSSERCARFPWRDPQLADSRPSRSHRARFLRTEASRGRDPNAHQDRVSVFMERTQIAFESEPLNIISRLV
jgi:hypothetical protein